MDLDALGHADILRREAVSSWQDPEVQSYCSPTSTLTRQHAHPHPAAHSRTPQGPRKVFAHSRPYCGDGESGGSQLHCP